MGDWRAESTFKKSSALTDEEKEFLKVSKKLRDILKLAERHAKGEALEQLQLDKVASKDKMLKEVTALAVKLPPHTEVLEKNQDITDLLPSTVQQKVSNQRQQDERRRERKKEQEEEERKKPVWMCRHEKPIVDVVVSQDGQYLFTCSKDKYVLCWSLKDRLLRCLCTFAGHQGAVWAVDVSWSTGLLVSGSADGKVNFWRPDRVRFGEGCVAQPAQTLAHGGIVRVLRWCPFDKDADSQRLASASEKLGSTPACIAVWRVSAKCASEQVLKLETPTIPSKANDLVWGAGAKTKIFSAHDNGYVGVWSAEAAGPPLKTIRLHSKPISALCLTPDGKTLITASHDATAAAVDISKPACETLQTYKVDRKLNAVTVSADFQPGTTGKIVVAGGKDERDVTTAKDMVEDEFDAKVLDSVEGEQLAAGTGHFGPVHRLLSLPGVGKAGAFATVSEDGCLKVHSFTGSLLHSDTLQ